MTLPHFRSLARQLIRRTVELAVLCMLLALGVQAWVIHQQQQAREHVLLAEIGSTSVPQLAVGLWDIEPEAVQAQVQRLAERPEIGYVRLQAVGGQRFEAGAPSLAAQAGTYRLAIQAPRGGMVLGELELVSQPDFYWWSLWRVAWQTLLGYGSFTAMICLLMAVMLKRDLQKPLEGMAEFAADLTPERLMTPLQLERPWRVYVDEIDLLAAGFSKLQTGLREHIGNLDRLVDERTRQQEALLEEIRNLSATDALTGAYNRRTLDERLPIEIERANRYDRSLSVVFVDVDHFKRINDTHGHAAGDQVLGEVARYIQAQLRQSVDWLVRYGGEEFLVILPETGLFAAIDVANRLRIGLEGLLIELGGGKVLRCTASFGVSTCCEREDSASLLARADALLYRAKTEGRNRVVAEA